MNSFELGLLSSSSAFLLPQGLTWDWTLGKRRPWKGRLCPFSAEMPSCCSWSEHILPAPQLQLCAYRGEPGTRHHTIKTPITRGRCDIRPSSDTVWVGSPIFHSTQMQLKCLCVSLSSPHQEVDFRSSKAGPVGCIGSGLKPAAWHKDLHVACMWECGMPERLVEMDDVVNLK